MKEQVYLKQLIYIICSLGRGLNKEHPVLLCILNAILQDKTAYVKFNKIGIKLRISRRHEEI